MGNNESPLGEVETGPGDMPIILFESADERNLCSLQMSGMIMETADHGNLTSFLWLGAGRDRMLLDRDQVSDLVVRLKEWLDTGTLN